MNPFARCLSRPVVFAAAMVLTSLVGEGCVLTRRLATETPGSVPWAGQFADAAGVGGDQVKFVFLFKVGADPRPAAVDAPADGEASLPPATAFADAAAADVRIVHARLIDKRGQPFAVIDQEVRRRDNLYTVTLTSAAVDPETYELTCQARLTVNGLPLILGGTAYREINRWRPDPESLRFVTYAAERDIPRYEHNLNPLKR